MKTIKVRTLASREFPPWWVINNDNNNDPAWRRHVTVPRHHDRRPVMSHLRVPDIRVLGLLDGDVSDTGPGRLAYSAPTAKLHGVAPALLLVPHSPSTPRRRHSWICRYLFHFLTWRWLMLFFRDFLCKRPNVFPPSYRLQSCFNNEEKKNIDIWPY